MRTILRKWDFILAVAFAAAGACFLPTDAIKDITTELIAFFGIQSAAILPAMIFTAGILKPDGLGLSEAERYHKALKSQMHFWVALLGLDFVAIVALIAGKVMKWTLALPIPNSTDVVDVSWVFPTVLFFAGSLAILRIIPFVRGVLSLLDLNSEMAQKTITRRNRLEAEAKREKADSSPMVLPEDYGKVIQPGANGN